MRLTSNIYLVAIVVAVIALTTAGVFGAGVASGLGIWPRLGNPFSGLTETETIFHDERPTIIHQVQSLARLQTSHYSIEKIIEAEITGGALRREFLFGDRLFLVAHGFVIAGVDLSAIDEADIDQIDDNSVWMMLPPSEIFVATLDNDLTRVYDRNRGWLTRGDDQLESEARREAEQLMLMAACDDGVLEHAAQNAEDHMRAFLSILGFEEIAVVAPVGDCVVERTGE